MERVLGFPILGQSNSWGHGSSTYPVVGDHWRFAPSGLWTPLKDDHGNQRINQEADDLYKMGHGPRDKYSFEGALCDSLVAHGVSGIMATIPCGKDGSTSGDWFEGLNVTPTPTVRPELVQAAKHRIWDFLRSTAAVLGAIVIYQGESNAVGRDATPSDWLVHWDAICDEFAVLPFAGKTKFVVVQLPPTQPQDAPFPDWQAVRVAQETLVTSARASANDCVLVTAPENALVARQDYHLETGADESEGLRKLGTDIGAAIAGQLAP